MKLNELLDQIVILCIGQAVDKVEFEEGVPNKAVLLEDLMNIMDEFKVMFKGHEVIKE